MVSISNHISNIWIRYRYAWIENASSLTIIYKFLLKLSRNLFYNFIFYDIETKLEMCDLKLIWNLFLNRTFQTTTMICFPKLYFFKQLKMVCPFIFSLYSRFVIDYVMIKTTLIGSFQPILKYRFYFKKNLLYDCIIFI